MKLRTLLCTLALLLALSACAFAKPAIKADQQYLDINTGLYILKGNVSIEVPNRTITAGQAKINMSSLEVWAADGVSLRQDDIYFSGDAVYVYGTQNKADINGHVCLSRSGLVIKAAQVEYDWDTKIALFSGQVEVTQDNAAPYSTDSLRYNVATNTIL